MRTQVFLGERVAWVFQDFRAAAADIACHLQFAQSEGKGLCDFREVELLDTTWQQVFGVECISCKDHPISFFVPAGLYPASERRDVLAILRHTINSFITLDTPRRDIYEKLLKDDLL